MADWTDSPAGASWNAETIATYYRDPKVEWFDRGDPLIGHRAAASGCYILHFCGDANCCRPVGPFASIEEAREWSRQHLALNLQREVER